MANAKLFPGLLSAVLEGLPAVVGWVKPLLKKKKLSDEELLTKKPDELVSIVKQHQSEGEEKWYTYVLKRAVTLATIYFVVYASKKLGVTSNDILNLFGLLQ